MNGKGVESSQDDKKAPKPVAGSEEPSVDSWSKAKKVAAVATLGMAGAAVSPWVHAPVVVGALGFGAGGIAAGSTAASLMSAAWTTGFGVGLVGAAQSIGATGVVGATAMAAGGGAAAAGGLLGMSIWETRQRERHLQKMNQQDVATQADDSEDSLCNEDEELAIEVDGEKRHVGVQAVAVV